MYMLSLVLLNDYLNVHVLKSFVICTYKLFLNTDVDFFTVVSYGKYLVLTCYY